MREAEDFCRQTCRYSDRRAVNGSARVARRARIKLATAATDSRIPAIAVSSSGLRADAS
jgi:hypothetical protein